MTLCKYTYPSFIAACGTRPFVYDIQQWVIFHDVTVNDDNWILIARQIRNYFAQPQGERQLSLFAECA